MWLLVEVSLEKHIDILTVLFPGTSGESIYDGKFPGEWSLPIYRIISTCLFWNIILYMLAFVGVCVCMILMFFSPTIVQFEFRGVIMLWYEEYRYTVYLFDRVAYQCMSQHWVYMALISRFSVYLFVYCLFGFNK